MIALKITYNKKPTLPPFCTCGINTVEVNKANGWYSYINEDTCLNTANISVPIKGELSQNVETPGFLMENFSPKNHTLSNHLDPNMIFNVTYGESNTMELALTYACISKRLFSFNILSRSNQWSSIEIENIIEEANVITGGLLKVSGMRISNESTYEACGMIR